MLGLIGAHRVGKSTLMNSLDGFDKVQISIGDMQKSIGYDSSKQDYSFKDRMIIQKRLLSLFKDKLLRITHTTRVIRSVSKVVVTDRTPLDLIGYTLNSFPENSTNEEQVWLRNYIQACIDLTNEFYTNIVLIQPGIPLVKDNDTSAECDPVFIERLNAIYLSYLMDNRVKPNTYAMPRDLTDLAERVQYIKEILL